MLVHHVDHLERSPSYGSGAWTACLKSFNAVSAARSASSAIFRSSSASRSDSFRLSPRPRSSARRRSTKSVENSVQSLKCRGLSKMGRAGSSRTKRSKRRAGENAVQAGLLGCLL